jgi:hypothetical protein
MLKSWSISPDRQGQSGSGGTSAADEGHGFLQDSLHDSANEFSAPRRTSFDIVESANHRCPPSNHASRLED